MANENVIRKLGGHGIVIRGNEIDTDRIIPARYMKAITFEGLGRYAFQDERFDERGNPKEHPFNDPRFKAASILIVNKNFGCGSSREHAPQALRDWGIKAVVGESFAEIFAGNCTAIGVPAVIVSEADAAKIADTVEREASTEITIDLSEQRLHVGSTDYSITMPAPYRNSLTAGSWDSTATLLANLEDIEVTARALPYMNGFNAALSGVK